MGTLNNFSAGVVAVVLFSCLRCFGDPSTEQVISVEDLGDEAAKAREDIRHIIDDKEQWTRFASNQINVGGALVSVAVLKLLVKPKGELSIKLRGVELTQPKYLRVGAVLGVILLADSLGAKVIGYDKGLLESIFDAAFGISNANAATITEPFHSHEGFIALIRDLPEEEAKAALTVDPELAATVIAARDFLNNQLSSIPRP